MMSKDLAVIIPAYKKKYFRESLLSLRGQTSKDFAIYIGDDCSPEDLKSVVDEFHDLSICYYRFPENLGGKNLVGQWERCVALSKEEKWIWLFSDDDIADSRCVEKFYDIATKRDVDIFRFNTATIDSQGKVGSYAPIGPDYESSESMAYQLLLGNRGNSMPDHIFSRDVYQRKNGFVKTDYGQSADWATSILFSQEKGIQIIPDAILYWRRSGVNITNLASRNRDATIKGYIQFVYWIIKHFQYLKVINSQLKYTEMLQATRVNFLMVVTSHYKGLSWKNLGATVDLMRGPLELSRLACTRYFFKIYSKTGPVIAFLAKCKRILKLIV